MKKIYDSRHQAYTICNWKKRGLICREGETYKDIYYYVMSIDNCQLCSVKFTDIESEKRCMDHCHETGFFRKVLCNKCNASYMKKINKTGHMFISPQVMKNNKPKNGMSGVSASFQYGRKGFKKKVSQSLTKLIAYSFIQLLKVPI
mgnify:CR=1 FL=1|tara:strand:- start:148 stop:585 length:438 start_codon:yes stop_codon:yes gene_type:complete